MCRCDEHAANTNASHIQRRHMLRADPITPSSVAFSLALALAYSLASALANANANVQANANANENADA